MSEKIQQYLDRYQSEGLSFFPLPLKSKESMLEWKKWQSRLPTPKELEKWANHKTDFNLAVVCGKISGNLVVLDFDSMERFYTWLAFLQEKNITTEVLEYTRCSQTSKGIHVWLRAAAPIKSQKFPMLDIKGEGGYIIVPPSIHPTGFEYKFLNDLPIKQIDDLTQLGIDLSQQPEAPRNQPGWVSDLLKGVGEGMRNDAAAKLAGYFRNLMPQDVTERLMLDWNKKNSPPLPDREILNTVASCYRLPEHPPKIFSNAEPSNVARYEPSKNVMKRENLSAQIKDWIIETGGAWFTTQELDHDLNIKDETEKTSRRTQIYNLKKEGFLQKHEVASGKFRYIDAYAEKIDILRATGTALDISLPFALHDMVKILPKTLMVCAGSADAGKTAFAFNLCALNLGKMPIHYFSSEMGDDELKSRLSLFGEPTLQAFAEFIDFRARYAEYSDVIQPNDINIIDYLTLTDEFYKINGYLIKIHEKLKSGMALVLLQKNRGAELGTGGNKGLERPRLYFTMDNHILKIQKAKNWVDSSDNPNQKQIDYKLVDGCKFIMDGGWYKEEKD